LVYLTNTAQEQASRLMPDQTLEVAAARWIRKGNVNGTRRILDDGFQDDAGCVVLAWFADPARRASLKSHGDETAFEAFANHLHVEDILDDGAPKSEVLRQTMAYAVCLGERLTVAFPPKRFEIIVSVGDSHTVRFTTARPDQPSWLGDDLDGYEAEAVMALVVPSPN
jgi:hypothetical protein